MLIFVCVNVLFGVLCLPGNAPAPPIPPGVFVSEPDGVPNVKARKLIFPNGSWSCTDGECTFTLTASPSFTDFYLYGPDVTHGMTSIAPTADYLAAFQIGSAGGADVYGMTEADQAGALRLTGIIGATDPTDTNPAVILRGGKKNGTGWQALAAAETAFVFYNYTTLLGQVYGNGEWILPSLENTPIGQSIARAGKFTQVDIGATGPKLVEGAADAEAEIGYDGTDKFSFYGNGEDFYFRPGSAANTILFGSTTGVTLLDFGTDIRIKSGGFDVHKDSGVAGAQIYYEANSTDTNGTGWIGPASVSSDVLYQFSNSSRVTGSDQVLVITNVGESGDGTTGNPYVQQMTPTYRGAALTPVTDSPANFAANFTGANLYGGTFRSNAAGTAVFPEPLPGMIFTYVLVAAEANVLDPLGTGTADKFEMNGLPLEADENMTSSTLGAECVFQYLSANNWMASCHGFAEATLP
jgi:hypothetical protein